jgi:hypothetical protein
MKIKIIFLFFSMLNFIFISCSLEDKNLDKSIKNAKSGPCLAAQKSNEACNPTLDLDGGHCPKCDSDGYFTVLQKNGSSYSAWCVDRESGKETSQRVKLNNAKDLPCAEK